MPADLQILLITAISIAFLHTITGPDHYLPFVALSKSRGWSVSKTIFWTIFCGCGHVWSSVLLGLGGAAIGWSISQVNWLENVRGGIAGWSLIAFGLVYCIWGIVRTNNNKLHKHFDVNSDGSVYVYEHKDTQVVAPKERHRVTPWVMFIVFLLGPCEPMIPLLSFPGAQRSLAGMVMLIVVYTLITLSTMLLMVLGGYYGFSILKLNKLQQYIHPLSGLTILLCGTSMVFLGW
jgi:sulfite exporter TauE/SafE